MVNRMMHGVMNRMVDRMMMPVMHRVVYRMVHLRRDESCHTEKHNCR
jgi:hypothetical protein